MNAMGMKLTEIRKELGGGNLCAIETSPYEDVEFGCPIMIIREYNKEIDWSPVVLYVFEKFYDTDRPGSRVLSAIREITGSEKVFAYSNFRSGVSGTEQDEKYGWINLYEDKYGAVRDSETNYLVCLPKSIKLEDLDGKASNGIRFCVEYTLYVDD